MGALIFLLVMVAVAIGAFNFAWYITDGHKGHPWNWRVCLGPQAYFPWLTERVPDWFTH